MRRTTECERLPLARPSPREEEGQEINPPAWFMVTRREGCSRRLAVTHSCRAAESWGEVL
jgi:hypothetical protein